MREHLIPILASIPRQPQRQDSTNDQLQDIATFANRLGCYDAADAIHRLLDHNTAANILHQAKTHPPEAGATNEAEEQEALRAFREEFPDAFLELKQAKPPSDIREFAWMLFVHGWAASSKRGANGGINNHTEQ